jgi:hypothetical protein
MLILLVYQRLRRISLVLAYLDLLLVMYLLIGVFKLTVCEILRFSVSVMLSDIKIGFSWKLVVVYSSPYEEGKQAFLGELHSVMNKWSGPTLIGGDFNLVHFSRDKSNGSSTINGLMPLMSG